ncbi:MAG: hypothetical protein ACOX6W_04920 [Lentisphaeria bacterium]|jgi:hypothetical protein
MTNPLDNSKFDSLFPLDESLGRDFLRNLYRGDGYTGRALTKFYGFLTLWRHNSDRTFVPVGTLHAKHYGFFKEKEKGIFTFKTGKIGWPRDKYTTTWKPSAYKDYKFKYGFTLRFLHFGKGYLFSGNEFLCSFNYPVRGPTSYQTKDCTGFFQLKNGSKIHFLIEPAHQKQTDSHPNYYIHRGKFYPSPRINTSPLFPQPDELSEFESLKKEERMLLVILALKARLFSVYR